MDSPPDVRPSIIDRDGVWLLAGFSCPACGYRLAVAAPWCPLCHGEVAPTDFGPSGTVWGSTILRVPVGGYEPPRALAYVDVDDGPRLICELAGTADTPVPVGSRVELTSPSPEGNPVARCSA